MCHLPYFPTHFFDLFPYILQLLFLSYLRFKDYFLLYHCYYGGCLGFPSRDSNSIFTFGRPFDTWLSWFWIKDFANMVKIWNMGGHFSEWDVESVWSKTQYCLSHIVLLTGSMGRLALPIINILQTDIMDWWVRDHFILVDRPVCCCFLVPITL